MKVAEIIYYEYLPSGEISIGGKSYKQDWSEILASLGFNREKYTFSTETINYIDELETLNVLTIKTK